MWWSSNDWRAISAWYIRTNEWRTISACCVHTNEWRAISVHHVVVEVTSRLACWRSETIVDIGLRNRWSKSPDILLFKTCAQSAGNRLSYNQIWKSLNLRLFHLSEDHQWWVNLWNLGMWKHALYTSEQVLIVCIYLCCEF